jgi:hypothetical protein
MERKRYAREFKLEAVRLVKERGVSVAQWSCPRLTGHRAIVIELA